MQGQEIATVREKINASYRLDKVEAAQEAIQETMEKLAVLYDEDRPLDFDEIVWGLDMIKSEMGDRASTLKLTIEVPANTYTKQGE